jgi:hypothetical protein
MRLFIYNNFIKQKYKLEQQAIGMANFRARICNFFKEPRDRFPAWRNRFLDLLKRLQIRAQVVPRRLFVTALQ